MDIYEYPLVSSLINRQPASSSLRPLQSARYSLREMRVENRNGCLSRSGLVCTAAERTGSGELACMVSISSCKTVLRSTEPPAEPKGRGGDNFLTLKMF